jgi:hypothetical protein
MRYCFRDADRVFRAVTSTQDAAPLWQTDPMMIPSNYILTVSDLKKAHSIFRTKEPRDLFYRAATELVRLALEDSNSSLPVADALAVLLQTWNSAYYRFRKPDMKNHYRRIDSVYDKHRKTLSSVRCRTIEDLHDDEKPIIKNIFRDFEVVLGPVGAAKALHLLAPSFFPIWDRAVATKYKVTLGEAGTNANRYWRFMEIARFQCLKLKGKISDSANLLKRIDEYNYCKFSRHWM